MFILLTIASPLSFAAAKESCLGHLRPAVAQAPAASPALTDRTQESFIDADFRYAVSRSTKIAAPISKESVNLNTSTETASATQSKARAAGTASELALNPIFEALNLEGVFYGLNTSSFVGYLKTLSHPNSRDKQSVQFVFWEGRDQKIETSSVVKGKLLDVQLVPAQQRRGSEDRLLQNVDHFILTIQEKNSLGELLTTKVSVPIALTGEKYRTISPPQLDANGQFRGYHWGILLGLGEAL